jgi:hypothetical protein
VEGIHETASIQRNAPAGHRERLSLTRESSPALQEIVSYKRGCHVALTENTGNIDNTPEIGWQVAYSFNPGWN